MHMKTNTPSLILIPLLIAFALLQSVHAVVPAPDGGYPNFNTAEGTNALQHLTTGAGNTAAGWYSLFTTSTGDLNTAVGAGTLVSNSTGSHNTANGALALLLNTTGDFNTAIGDSTLLNNTEGFGNTAQASPHYEIILLAFSIRLLVIARLRPTLTANLIPPWEQARLSRTLPAVATRLWAREPAAASPRPVA